MSSGTVSLVALVVGSVFGDRGLLSLIEKRQGLEALHSEIEVLRGENARLLKSGHRTSPARVSECPDVEDADVD